jgi:uncharacterized protein (DUF1697 family)
MARFAAFLRGVSPMNCKMPELAKAFAAAGFSNVKTLLSSGNVVFSASGAERSVTKKAQGAITQQLGQSFQVFVRPMSELQALVDADPYSGFKLKPEAKRVVTFLAKEPATPPKLPIELDGAKILSLQGREVFSFYIVGPKGPVFMTLIERTFGKDVTTRTWDTLRKVCAAA